MYKIHPIPESLNFSELSQHAQKDINIDLGIIKRFNPDSSSTDSDYYSGIVCCIFSVIHLLFANDRIVDEGFYERLQIVIRKMEHINEAKQALQTAYRRAVLCYVIRAIKAEQAQNFQQRYNWVGVDIFWSKLQPQRFSLGSTSTTNKLQIPSQEALEEMYNQEMNEELDPYAKQAVDDCGAIYHDYMETKKNQLPESKNPLTSIIVKSSTPLLAHS